MNGLKNRNFEVSLGQVLVKGWCEMRLLLEFLSILDLYLNVNTTFS